MTTCPKCNRSLKVPESLIGRNVKCPGCGTLFVVHDGEGEGRDEAADESRRESIRSATPPGRQPEPEADYEIVAGERRSARRREAQEEGYDQDYEDDRRRGRAPHRGGLVLALGIISVVSGVAGVLTLCCLVFAVFPLLGMGLGIPAWVMGRRDLARMADGDMDDSGRGITQTGSVFGIIGTILSILMLVAWVVLTIVVFGMQPPGRAGFGGAK